MKEILFDANGKEIKDGSIVRLIYEQHSHNKEKILYIVWDARINESFSGKRYVSLMGVTKDGAGSISVSPEEIELVSYIK